MKDSMSFLSKIVQTPNKSNHVKYLKWENAVVGIIQEDYQVKFTSAMSNVPLSLGNPGEIMTSEEYRSFLVDRLPSKYRRDIESLLRRCGLVEYNEFRLAEVTRAFNARDLFWIADNPEDKMEDYLDQVFRDIFLKHVDLGGESLISPDGVNKKRYGISKGYYGLLKHRLHPMSTDVESEVAVYNLSVQLLVRCCPAWLESDKGKTVAFSRFEYNFAKEFIVHARRLFSEGELTGELYKDLVNKIPEFKENLQQMILLDFITRQTDRHLSNIAFKISGDDVSFYPLYDNGRSLFFEDSSDFSDMAIQDIKLYATEFGEVGTYYDIVQDIAKEVSPSELINLNVSKDQIFKCYSKAGLTGEKLRAAVIWSERCLQYLKMISY